MLTVSQAARHLGLSEVRVRQLIRAGRLPATRPGRDWLIEEKNLRLVRYRKHGRPAQGKRKKTARPSAGILARLRRIKIEAPPDFAANLDLYLSGEKSAGS